MAVGKSGGTRAFQSPASSLGVARAKTGKDFQPVGIHSSMGILIGDSSLNQNLSVFLVVTGFPVRFDLASQKVATFKHAKQGRLSKLILG